MDLIYNPQFHCRAVRQVLDLKMDATGEGDPLLGGADPNVFRLVWTAKQRQGRERVTIAGAEALRRMEIIFLYGPAAAGKLTIGRALAKLTGLPLFHNHLVVDAIGAVFPFGSEPFVRLRESFWLQTFSEAARSARSLIFTFAPEATVDPGFPDRVRAAVERFGGSVVFIALTVSREEQERRIGNASRSEFGKLTSVDLLRELRDSFDASTRAMPTAEYSIDTEAYAPAAAAERIAAYLAAR